MYFWTSLEFLGHIIDTQDIRPLPSRIDALQRMEPPKSLHQFIGIVNFYRHFIPKCAEKMLPSTQLLKSQRKIDCPVTPSSEALNLFDQIKKEIFFVPLLAHPVLNAPLSLTVDALDSAVGAVPHC